MPALARSYIIISESSSSVRCKKIGYFKINESLDLVRNKGERMRFARLIYRALRFHENDPKTFDPKSMRGHIVKQHLKAAAILINYGVPRGDLEVLAYRKQQGLPGFNANWVVKKIYEFLENPPIEEIKKLSDMKISPFTETGYFYVGDYKALLVKTLMYIEELGLAKIDWPRLEKIVPDAKKITLSITEDSVDDGFPPYRKLVRKKVISKN